MRRIAVHMQATFNNRIANADGGFWEPFAWGEEEMAHLNRYFRAADTWALTRKLYEAIVPWWDTVAKGEVPDDAPPITAADREFAAMLTNMTKVVFSRTLPPAEGRVVVSGDIAGELTALKQEAGKTIVLSCGPATLAPLAGTPGLIDEYLIAMHPAVIGNGPQLFDGLATDLALRLVEAKAFNAGCILLHYEVVPPPSNGSRLA
jgi:dihydrofolate reductase